MSAATVCTAAGLVWLVTSIHKQLHMLCSYVHLAGVLSEEELQEHIDPVYEDFLNRRIEVPGKS